MRMFILVLVTMTLTACGMPNADRVDGTCKMMMEKARTSTDTLIVMSAKPSSAYTTCGYAYYVGEIK